MRKVIEDRFVEALSTKLAIPGNQARILFDAGFEKPGEVRAMKDTELLAIPGIGQAAVNKIRRKP